MRRGAGAKQDRLQAYSPTDAADAMYVSRGATLEEYVQALPRLDGQSGVLVGLCGRLVCLDYVLALRPRSSSPGVMVG